MVFKTQLRSYAKLVAYFVIIIAYITGMILVHDLTNRKSEENLQKWLSEVLNPESCSFGKNYSHYDEFDSENFLGSTQVKVISNLFLILLLYFNFKLWLFF